MSAAIDLVPSGVGDDIVSFVIALPFLVVGGLWAVVALLELLAELVVLPFVVLLRLARVMPWSVEEVHRGDPRPHEDVRGFLASQRLRSQRDEELRAAHLPRQPFVDVPEPAAPLSTVS